MVTKKYWEEVKTKQEFPIEICFEYYQEKGGIVDFTQFQRIFPQLIVKRTIILNSQNQPVILDFESIYHKIFNHYETKFKS